ncbi:proline--tRNA ligase [Cohnella zeiphila]|uniref:Proline--tRNA ligase n=1 Tax=Cohnella zeiphila TaxID=2761120 RepID=A0A7X0SRV2_9BACL|nr:proline--tRNA ligase [Cohnella zeiphila]MBB6734816.1 proline--tRNA ligase [Cohnella zeiphila]
MRQSSLFAPTLREAPSEAEAASHRLLLRAGMIRQTAAGVYTYLPLAWRVLRKLEQIVREEMDRTGAQELRMPSLQPAELWQESGRYGAYGPELVRLRDRHDREFALGPTHEEVVTALVRDELHSYRQLPMTLYQIQTKFRDERRPRYGLLRGREFLMKDAYSFDTGWDGLGDTYRRMHEAYERIFRRCGVDVRAVEADAGAIGGEGGTHEFMALADIGEDTIATCSHCGYAANLEKAEARAAVPEKEEPEEGELEERKPEKKEPEEGKAAKPAPAAEKIHTPGSRTVEQLAEAAGARAQDIIKTIVALADGKAVAILVRGDHEVSEIKVRSRLGAASLELADPETVARLTGCPVGYLGPVGMKLPLLVDHAVAAMNLGIAGAGEPDWHLRNVRPGRDFPLDAVGDFRQAQAGDACPRCDEGSLRFYRGIEVGQIFKLGTKYSAKLNAVFTNPEGQVEPVLMGCYGIGVSRLLSAVAEQHHDEAGLIWPWAVAPFHVHVVPVSVRDEVQMAAAESLYRTLTDSGVEVLMDDREERPGVKFKDADLLGIPIRIVIGKQAGEGLVEYKERNQAESAVVTAEEAADRIQARRNVS